MSLKVLIPFKMCPFISYSIVAPQKKGASQYLLKVPTDRKQMYQV